VAGKKEFYFLICIDNMTDLGPFILNEQPKLEPLHA